MTCLDIISDSTGKEIVAAIKSTDVAQARISEINQAAELKKNEVLASIPEDYRNTVDEVNQIKGDLDDVNNVIGTDSEISKQFSEQCGMMYNGEKIIQSNANYNSILIRVRSELTITFTTNINPSSKIVLTEKPYVGMNVERINATNPFTASNGDKYLLFTFNVTGEQPIIEACFSDSGLLKTVKNLEIEKESKKNVGMTIVNFGDSLFGNFRDDTSISVQLANLTGATVYNCGFGGCQMTHRPYRLQWSPFSMCHLADSIATGDWTLQDEQIVNTEWTDRPSYFAEHLNKLKTIDFSKVDLITISYATNDWGSHVSIENNEDKKDLLSVNGALRYSIETILNAYPNIRIIICTPMWRGQLTDGVITSDADTATNTKGLILPQYVEGLKEVAKEYHLPICDFYYDMSLNKFNWSAFFNPKDLVHPKAEGRYFMAKYLASKVMPY